MKRNLFVVGFFLFLMLINTQFCRGLSPYIADEIDLPELSITFGTPFLLVNSNNEIITLNCFHRMALKDFLVRTVRFTADGKQISSKDEIINLKGDPEVVSAHLTNDQLSIYLVGHSIRNIMRSDIWYAKFDTEGNLKNYKEFASFGVNIVQKSILRNDEIAVFGTKLSLNPFKEVNSNLWYGVIKPDRAKFRKTTISRRKDEVMHSAVLIDKSHFAVISSIGERDIGDTELYLSKYDTNGSKRIECSLSGRIMLSDDVFIYDEQNGNFLVSLDDKTPPIENVCQPETMPETLRFVLMLDRDLKVMWKEEITKDYPLSSTPYIHRFRDHYIVVYEGGFDFSTGKSACPELLVYNENGERCGELVLSRNVSYRVGDIVVKNDCCYILSYESDQTLKERSFIQRIAF